MSRRVRGFFVVAYLETRWQAKWLYRRLFSLVEACSLEDFLICRGKFRGVHVLSIHVVFLPLTLTPCTLWLYGTVRDRFLETSL